MTPKRLAALAPERPPREDGRPARAAPAGAEGRESAYRRFGREFRRERYVDVAKDTQFSDAWFMLALLLTMAGLLLSNQFLLAAALALLLSAGVSWLWNEFSLFGVHYGRSFSETRAFLGETIELTLEVRNRKFLPLMWLEITDTFPGPLPVDDRALPLDANSSLGQFSTFWSVGAFQSLTRRYRITCTQRGYFAFGPAQVSTGDGFGLFSRTAALPREERILIYPRLYSVAEMRLPAGNPFGERVAAVQLFEDPLRTSGIRRWRPGDSLRRVHWKATARHQELLSRVYEPSEEPQILVFLNVATLPQHWQGIIPELQERAISVAGSLAALAIDLRYPVGVVANGLLTGSDQPLRLLPGRSPDQLVHIMELLALVTPYVITPIEVMLVREAPRLPWGATVVVVTAVVYDKLLAALLEAVKAGRRVLLFTLAEKAPAEQLPGVRVYHLPHLVADLIAPLEVAA